MKKGRTEREKQIFQTDLKFKGGCKMKKMICFSMILSLLLLLLVPVYSEIVKSGACGENLTWTLTQKENNSFTLTISGTGPMNDYSAELAAPWRGEAPEIEEIILEEGITKIGSFSFSGCYNLENISFPNTIQRIEKRALSDCDNLKTITIPASVTFIDDSAFSSCDYLKEIIVDEQNKMYSSIDNVLFNKDKTVLINYFPRMKTNEYYQIPDGVTTIKKSAFYDCDTLKEIIFPNSLLTIEDTAFYSCNSLKQVSFPSSLLTIEEGAFSYCYALENVSFSYGVVTIGKKAFFMCRKLTGVSFPDSITSIGESAFEQTNLTEVHISKGVTEISDSVFESCSSLKKVILPEGIKKIGSNAFSGCYLEELNLPDTITTIGKNAFNGNSLSFHAFPKELQSIGDWPVSSLNVKELILPENVTSIGEFAFFGHSQLEKIILPEGLEYIGKNAFEDCDNLTEIFIPKSVSFIGDEVFLGCDRLTAIEVDPNNPYFSSVDGNLLNKNKTAFLTYAIGKTDSHYAIPDSVTWIQWFAFRDREIKLKSLTIPHSVTHIGAIALYVGSDFAKIYYDGTEADWENIDIDPDNDLLRYKSQIQFSVRVFYNGNRLSFDQPPIIQNNRTLVPLRTIFETMGAEVFWDEETQTVTSQKGDVTITLSIGSNVLVRNGVETVLDVPAQLYNGRTMVPLRVIAESFGCTVDWENDTQTVLIYE